MIRRDAGVAQVAQRFLGHFAGADHQRLLVVESLEDLLGEIGHGHAGDAHAALVDGGLGGHATGDADGRLKGRVQQRPGVVVLDGRLVGLLHLGENLRLADHHAVETGGHGEQVPHRLFADVMIQVRRDLRRIELVEAGQKARHLLAAGGHGRLAGRVDLDAIARREQHRFRLAKHPPPMVQGLPGLLGGNASRSRMAIDVP